MERRKRTKDPNTDLLPRWRKKGGGTHRMADGRKLRAGDIVRCTREELGGVIDLFDCLDVEPLREEAPQIKMFIQSRGSGWYDVVNPATSKAINDKPMRKKDALVLINAGDLSEEEIEKLIRPKPEDLLTEAQPELELDEAAEWVSEDEEEPETE